MKEKNTKNIYDTPYVIFVLAVSVIFIHQKDHLT